MLQKYVLSYWHYLYDAVCIASYCNRSVSFYIKKAITDVSRNVDEKIREVKEILSHPKEVAAHIGATVAGTALHQAVAMIKSLHK